MSTAVVPKKKRRTPGAPAGHERMAAMSARIGFSPSTIYSWIVDEKMGFPKPIKLTKNVAIFPIKAVDSWLTAHDIAVPAQGAL